MAKMMVLGVKGEAGLWVVDFEAGTVVAMDGNRENYLAAHDLDVENEHAADVALTFETKTMAFSGQYFQSKSRFDESAAATRP